MEEEKVAAEEDWKLLVKVEGSPDDSSAELKRGDGDVFKRRKTGKNGENFQFIPLPWANIVANISTRGVQVKACSHELEHSPKRSKYATACLLRSSNGA